MWFVHCITNTMIPQVVITAVTYQFKYVYPKTMSCVQVRANFTEIVYMLAKKASYMPKNTSYIKDLYFSAFFSKFVNCTG